MICFPQMPRYIAVPGNPDLIELTVDYLGPNINGKRTLVKAGFRCDGGSIPRFCWPFIFHPLQAPFIAAAIPHDGEYAAELYERIDNDKRLYAACRALNIGWLKSRLIYRAVRIGGKFVWKRHTQDSIANAGKFVECVNV